MPEASEFRRAEPDGIDRCQAVGGTGQCPLVAINGTKYCQMHGGMAGVAEKKKIRNYQLGKFQAKMEAFADNPNVKSVREELGISRLLLEEIVNRCEDAHDLLLNSNKISDLVMKINTLVISCHKMEEKTGMLIDKSMAINMATSIIDIIGEEVKDTGAIEVISRRILEIIIGKSLPEGDDDGAEAAIS